MWIRQLEVTDCAGIKAASLALQPGLNVLHGPNELGKSTLVKAIRAALLLPAQHTEAKSLYAWNVDGPPRVALTFEQEAQRVWRVRKRFGRRGSETYLYSSRDGTEFSQEGRGREVEGMLQKILRWGIEPPGGKGGKRGMPESFITTALLGDQRDIDAILGASLAGDPNASGRERLTDALQALAEDPRLKQVLAAVQVRFNEAFTATGRRRAGRGSPWSNLQVARSNAQQREQSTRQQVERSEAERSRVVELQRQALNAQAEAEGTARKLKAEQAAERQRSERAAAAAALAAAKEALQKAQAQVRSRDERIAAVTASEKKTQRSRERLAAAEQALTAVQPLAKAAADRVQQLQSSDAEQGRRLAEQEAKNRQLELTQQKTELEAQVKAAQEIARREADVQAIHADVERRTKALEEQRSSLAAAKAKTAEDAAAIEALERARACARYLAARNEAEALAAKRDAAKAHAQRAQSLDSQAQEARAQAQALNAPAQAELDELNRLAADRRIANAKLAVGLSLEFTPTAAGTADVTQDGATSQRPFDAGSRLRFEAQRELRLAIDGIGVLEVRGGGRHLRDEAQEATSRWRKFADNLYDRAGVATSAELEDKRQDADQLLAVCAQYDVDAKQARGQSENLDELERQATVAQASAAQCQQAAAKRMAHGASVDDYLEEHRDLRDEAELAQAMEALKDEAHRRDALAIELASKMELDAAQLGNLRQDWERRRQELGDATAENEEWRRVIAAAEADGQQLVEELAKVDAELRAIQAESTAAVDDARGALAKISEEESAKTRTRDEAARSLLNAETSLARLQGEAETMHATVAALDLSGLQAAHDEKQALLNAFPPVDEASSDLAELDRLANDAANHADALRHQLSTAQGALGQVGGQRIEERAAQAKEALAVLARREHELEVEYGGWKLLHYTLNETQREHDTHLGDALVKPVSERMAALTRGRYSEVGIGPQLNATGIRLGDDERSFNDVSVGTLQQIALLLRLAIAEALGSFVILDDHLTQSDPVRMEWIRGLLAEAARKIQVVVMTCHPDAYLAGGGAVEAHAVDLTKRIERHGVGV